MKQTWAGLVLCLPHVLINVLPEGQHLMLHAQPCSEGLAGSSVKGEVDIKFDLEMGMVFQ